MGASSTPWLRSNEERIGPYGTYLAGTRSTVPTVVSKPRRGSSKGKRRSVRHPNVLRLRGRLFFGGAFAGYREGSGSRRRREVL